MTFLVFVRPLAEQVHLPVVVAPLPPVTGQPSRVKVSPKAMEDGGEVTPAGLVVVILQPATHRPELTLQL